MANTDDDLRVFSSLFPEMTEEKIAADWAAWANEGRDPAADGDQWTDTLEGAAWWVMTRQAIREDARQYDVMGSEFVRSIFPQWSWGEYLDDHAELRNVGRKDAVKATGSAVFTGTAAAPIPQGTVVGVPPASPGAPAPTYETTTPSAVGSGGTVSVPIAARTAGLAGTVGAGAITSIITPTPNVTSVTNPAAVSGGADIENDEALSERVVTSFTGVAVANQAYYRRIALSVDGIGRATVIPVGNGPGTVTVIVSAADGGAPSAAAVAAAQAKLDPSINGNAYAAGQAGATVTVLGAAALDITVSAIIEPEPGYSLDGAGGSLELRSKIARALAAYISTIAPGGEIVLARIIGEIAKVTGVHDVGSVKINNSATNLTVPSSPPRSPRSLAPSLTAGVL